MKKLPCILIAALFMTGLIGSVRYTSHTVSPPVIKKVQQASSKPLLKKDVDKEEIKVIISKKSRKYGVDPKLINAIVKKESNYKPRAVSPKGALGLMQLMPKTAKGLNITDPFCPEQNIDGGIRHLKWLLGRYDQNVELALAAYNIGHRRVKDSIPDVPETVKYVSEVMRIYNGG